MFSEGPRAKQKRETREAILDAARSEFEAEGFDGANMRAIAKRAGVAAGTIIHHFGGKRELLHAAFFADLDDVLQRVLAKPGRGPLEARLKRLSRAVFRYYLARPALSRTQLKESLFADPPWAERFGTQVEQVHATVAGWVSEAIASGELAPTDPPLVAASYLSFFYFALLGWARGSVNEPEAMVASLMAHHLSAWRTESP